MAEKNTFLATLQNSHFQPFIKGVRGYANELTIEIEAKDVLEVMTILKNQFEFNYLSDITAVDHYTDELRFEVSYNLVSMAQQQRLRVSCRVDESDPSLDSVVSLWRSADWYEREAFDMMGIKFNHHPDLRRIYMPEDYEYFPLRKEFPLLGIPGSIPLPEKDPPKSYN